jgi:hypothetical protein
MILKKKLAIKGMLEEIKTIKATMNL